MKFDWHSRLAYFVAALVTLLVLSAINNGPLIWNQHAPSDLVDGRFNLYVLEHVYQWLIGRAPSLGSPGFYYPFPDVLYFSDIHAGSAIVYAFFRAIGQSDHVAYISWFLVGYLTTFLAAYYAVARVGCGPLTAALAASIFAFSLPSLEQFGHPQLVYRCGVPLAWLYLWQGMRDGSARAFLAAFFWLCIELLLSIYLGIFLLGFLLFFAATSPFLERGELRPWREWPRAMLNEARRSGWAFALLATLCLAAAAAVLAMLGGYAHTSAEYALTRDWSETASMLPRPASYLLADGLPYWRPISDALSNYVSKADEQNMFLGVGPSALVVVGLVAIARNSRTAIGAIPARALAASILGIVVITLSVGDDVTLYRPLASLPGLNAIRAVSRIASVLAFPAAILATIGLRALVAGPRRKVAGILVGAALVALTGFEFVTAAGDAYTRDTFAIADSEQRIATVVAVARERAHGISSPILAAYGEDNFETQVDAMFAAQRLGWPTVDGYSGSDPPGSYNFTSCSLASRRLAAYKTWQAQQRPKDPPIDPAALLGHVVFVGADCDAEPLNRSVVSAPTREEPVDPAVAPAISILPRSFHREGSLIHFSVTVKNGSANGWIPGLSSTPVFLSWRFVAMGAPDSTEGWDTREPILTDVGPGATTPIAAIAVVPTTPGDYRLEASMVAENSFWFHDKGMQTLRFSEAVTVP